MKNMKINILKNAVIFLICLIIYCFPCFAENITENINISTNTEQKINSENTEKSENLQTKAIQNNMESVNKTQNENKVVKQTNTENTNKSEEKKKDNITTNVVKKSNNANLSNLGITPNDFKGFNSQKTTYDTTVPKSIESITIYAKAQDSNAKINGTGAKKLQLGLNKFSIIVTAEDQTQKTYTINITRSNTDKETDMVNEKSACNGLEKIDIENLDLDPSFSTDIYEYKVRYIGEKESLDINATPTDSKYKIEIVGNQKLIEGENIINILVSNEKDENVAVYQITVDKSLIDEEAIAREKEEKNKKIMLIVGGIILFIIIISFIVFIIKKKRNRFSYYEDKELEYVIEDEEIEEKNEKLDIYEENNLSKKEKNKKQKDDSNKSDNNVNKFEKKNKRNKGKRFKN